MLNSHSSQMSNFSFGRTVSAQPPSDYRNKAGSPSIPPSSGAPIPQQHLRVPPPRVSGLSPFQQMPLPKQTSMPTQAISIGQNGNKLDINLNITVNRDGTVSAGTAGNPVNVLPQGHLPLPGSNYANGVINSQHFMGNSPMGNQVFAVPQAVVVSQQLIRGNRGMPGFLHPSHGVPKSNLQTMHPQPQQSPASVDPKAFNIIRDKVFCVICQQDYEQNQHDQHLQRHRISHVADSKLDHKINCIITDYDVKTGHHTRPIIEPEEFNIQYAPNKYIIEQQTQFETRQNKKPFANQFGVMTDSNAHQSSGVRLTSGPQQQSSQERSREQSAVPIRSNPSNTQQPSFILNKDNENSYVDVSYAQNDSGHQNKMEQSLWSQQNQDSIQSHYLGQRFDRSTFVSDRYQSNTPDHNILQNRETVRSYNRDTQYNTSQYLHQQPIRETDEEHRTSFPEKNHKSSAISDRQSSAAGSGARSKQPSSALHNGTQSYRQSQIPFDQILGERMGASYRAHEEKPLDILT